jgi:hypothetical protein
MNKKQSQDTMVRFSGNEASEVIPKDGNGVTAPSLIAIDHFKRTTLPQILSDVEMRRKGSRKLGRTSSVGTL